MPAPTFTDHLKQISSANIHDSYSAPTERSLKLMQGLANLLLQLDPDGNLPRANNNNPTPNLYHMLQSHGTVQFQMRVDLAFGATTQLAQMLQQIESLPQDQASLNRNIEALSHRADLFFSAWDYLLPALQASVGNTSAATQRAKEEAEQHTKAIKELLHDSQEAAKRIGAGEHAKQFSVLADQYKKLAQRWQYGTFGMVALFIAIVILTGYWTISIHENEYGKLVQVVVGKVLALGVLYYMVVFFARCYRANAHLEAVNRHRATALQIFKTFADAAGDDQTKNAILLETTRSIYAHTSTGFLSGEDPSSPIQIVEILKALGPNKNQQ